MLFYQKGTKLVPLILLKPLTVYNNKCKIYKEEEIYFNKL